MFKSRLLVGMAFSVLLAMVWLDWNFPTYMFYSPIARTNETVSSEYLFKKSIELSLSLFLVVITAAILRLKQSGNAEKFLASLSMGVGVGFWLQRSHLLAYALDAAWKDLRRGRPTHPSILPTLESAPIPSAPPNPAPFRTPVTKLENKANSPPYQSFSA